MVQEDHNAGRINARNKVWTGTMIVGEKASIDADVTVSVAVVMGEVNGTIDAKDRIEVYAPGRVGGDIQAPVIAIESGVMFEGNCNMGQPAGLTSTAKAPEPVESEGE